MEGDVIMLQDLFTFRLEAVPEDSKVAGELRSCGLRPSFERKFAKHGIELPPELFGPQPLSRRWRDEEARPSFSSPRLRPRPFSPRGLRPPERRLFA